MPIADETRERESSPKQTERSFETQKDERSAEEQLNAKELFLSNQKRTFDEFQDLSLESARRNRTYVDEVLQDSRNHSNNLNNVALQALQNAVENANFKAKNILDSANLCNKQAVAHRDIAIDREWNVDEQGYTAAEILRDNTFKDAIAGAVAAGFAQAVAQMTKEGKV